eukprot:SAG11_NODE_9131_length_940_cov_0.826397_1_plen_39_part_01
MLPARFRTNYTVLLCGTVCQLVSSKRFFCGVFDTKEEVF